MRKNIVFQALAGIIATIAIFVAVGCSSSSSTTANDQLTSATPNASGAVLAENANLGAGSSGRGR